MHRLGALFTVLALVAVQAPWIVCGCEDGAITPQLLGLFGHELACECHEGHEHDGHGHHVHGHGHHAHHGHGHHEHRGHRHAPDCPHHDHGHVAFHMALGLMPPSVTLDAAAVTFAPLALLAEAYEPAVFDEHDLLVDERPPGDPVAPSVRTERLLL